MRIGILGGTFDPIHQGHTQPAEEVKHTLGLDEIWLMPNHIPPHKQGPSVTTGQRLAMAELACENHQSFKVCDIEAQRNTPSYTSDTLAQIKQENPSYEFYFIMGMDSFINLTEWHNWEEIFHYAHIAVCKRPGWTLPEMGRSQQLFKDNVLNQQQNPHAKNGHIILVDVTQVDCSSTQIRSQLASGLSPDGLEPQIQQYIIQNHLYCSL